VWGENDPFGNLDVARQVARILPNASLHEMREGHLPSLDKPRECGDEIREFLYRDRTFNGRNASLGAEG
jgi:pimeloyl-ACP methyl ester carboxylesterase